jgi:hypothetical protein
MSRLSILVIVMLAASTIAAPLPAEGALPPGAAYASVSYANPSGKAAKPKDAAMAAAAVPATTASSPEDEAEAKKLAMYEALLEDCEKKKAEGKHKHVCHYWAGKFENGDASSMGVPGRGKGMGFGGKGDDIDGEGFGAGEEFDDTEP